MVTPLPIDVLVTALDEVFHGIGKLTGIQAHLHINKDVTPVVHLSNLRFGFSKCEFDQKQLEFFGHVFSGKGISPRSSKVQAVKDAPVPKNASEMRSFLWMI